MRPVMAGDSPAAMTDGRTAPGRGGPARARPDHLRPGVEVVAV